MEGFDLGGDELEVLMRDQNYFYLREVRPTCQKPRPGIRLWVRYLGEGKGKLQSLAR